VSTQTVESATTKEEAGRTPRRGTTVAVVSQRRIPDLVRGVVDALQIPGPFWLPSVAGWPGSWLPARYSEYEVFYGLDLLRATRYLADILIPSAPMYAPDWFPEPLEPLFFHPSRVEQHADQYGGWTSNPHETWLFVNGILTDHEMAQINASYLADLFHRPIMGLQNSTDGFVEDLAKCANEKTFRRIGEASTVAFPPLYDALKDSSKQRVVVIAHSQGTLIAAVLLRLIELIYVPGGRATGGRRDRDSVRKAMRDAGVGLDMDDFDALKLDDVAKLELYCFANCATQMRYVDERAQLPWIESFGNQYDIVARLGVLAPDPRKCGIAIDGPRYEREGAWGHLLNRHYLRAIDQRQRTGNQPGPVDQTADPFVLRDPRAWPDERQPRLYRYLNGGDAISS